jgi:uncharacterized protein (DUF2236 family)
VWYGSHIERTSPGFADQASLRRPPSGPALVSDEEIDDVILGPDSLVWQRFGDLRLFNAAGYALLLQVAHPTVGAGVRDHSTFEQDPWGRLLRTTDYLFLLSYGGREAAAMGRRLREVHKAIRGRNPDGSHYHALEPEAYAWVQATLFEGAIRAHLRFVGPLSEYEIEQMYSEFMPLGALIGIRDGDLPGSWPEFLDYFETTVNDTLVHHETVGRVLRSFSAPDLPPQLPDFMDGLWKLLRVPPSRTLWTTSIGLLPRVLRDRFGVEWTRANAVELRAFGAASRALGPRLPKPAREAGPYYLRWRRDEIAAGPLGPHGDPASVTSNGAGTRADAA